MTKDDPSDAICAYEDLRVPLRTLDLRLSDVLAAWPSLEGGSPGRSGSDERDVAALESELARPPGAPRVALGSGYALLPLTTGAEGRLAALQAKFHLSPFELDVVLIGLAPEVDRRYERLYRFVQGDFEADRPTVDLALDLLCTDADEKLARRATFSPGSVLIRFGLLRLDDEGSTRSSLSREFGLAEPATTFLLGLPPIAAPTGRWLSPDKVDRDPLASLPLAPADKLRLSGCLSRARDSGLPLDLRITGMDTDVLTAAGEDIAALAGRAMLVSDLGGAPGEDLAARVQAIMIGAALNDAMACFCLFNGAEDVPILTAIAATPSRAFCDLIVLTKGDRRAGLELAGGAAAFDLVALDYPARLNAWRSASRDAGLGLSEPELATLASRFGVSPAGMARACRVAAPAPEGEGFAALIEAVKGDRARELARFARRVDGGQDWDDLILPEPQMLQLRGLCDQVAHRHRVEVEWGFADKLSLGQGISALFAGPSGTGKTMAAGIVARALHLDLYRIDLSQTVSKFIGETEKNLDRIFAQARESDAVLFFDEADTLFGKRTEVKDSHDRYANLEVGYLLQKMEEYGGLAILATNLRQHIDEAFTRRLRAIIEFPFPDLSERLRIWKTVFPAMAPLADDVDFTSLARDVKLAGGSIRNIALSGAFLAAAEGCPIRQAHLERAAREEYRKVGRTWSGAEA
jgi:hypothetical protein